MAATLESAILSAVSLAVEETVMQHMDCLSLMMSGMIF